MNKYAAATTEEAPAALNILEILLHICTMNPDVWKSAFPVWRILSAPESQRYAKSVWKIQYPRVGRLPTTYLEKFHSFCGEPAVLSKTFYPLRRRENYTRFDDAAQSVISAAIDLRAGCKSRGCGAEAVFFPKSRIYYIKDIIPCLLLFAAAERIFSPFLVAAHNFLRDIYSEEHPGRFLFERSWWRKGKLISLEMLILESDPFEVITIKLFDVEKYAIYLHCRGREQIYCSVYQV